MLLAVGLGSCSHSLHHCRHSSCQAVSVHPGLVQLVAPLLLLLMRRLLLLLLGLLLLAV